ncbi:uncharacterized protein GGS25DRAFT_524380 [Hypoxylon fragiforme]|uniref:uncharacterized protein n=1 Tax=Hypoxylon fragiforme TaxID=63214 RepID=UPI0020C72B16|nr:uncharacterized protein GGS25DRAFT_524380 [Hypoxylon fragiforme]KAI2604886.1 hypothetical protein GGS25DRAFT_524380 [Hypoxylon fragiforme]
MAVLVEKGLQETYGVKPAFEDDVARKVIHRLIEVCAGLDDGHLVTPVASSGLYQIEKSNIDDVSSEELLKKQVSSVSLKLYDRFMLGNNQVSDWFQLGEHPPSEGGQPAYVPKLIAPTLQQTDTQVDASAGVSPVEQASKVVEQTESSQPEEGGSSSAVEGSKLYKKDGKLSEKGQSTVSSVATPVSSPAASSAAPVADHGDSDGKKKFPQPAKHYPPAVPRMEDLRRVWATSKVKAQAKPAEQAEFNADERNEETSGSTEAQEQQPLEPPKSSWSQVAARVAFQPLTSAVPTAEQKKLAVEAAEAALKLKQAEKGEPAPIPTEDEPKSSADAEPSNEKDAPKPSYAAALKQAAPETPAQAPAAPAPPERSRQPRKASRKHRSHAPRANARQPPTRKPKSARAGHENKPGIPASPGRRAHIAEPCRYFRNGTCRRGADCWFSHELVDADGAAAAATATTAPAPAQNQHQPSSAHSAMPDAPPAPAAANDSSRAVPAPTPTSTPKPSGEEEKAIAAQPDDATRRADNGGGSSSTASKGMTIRGTQTDGGALDRNKNNNNNEEEKKTDRRWADYTTDDDSGDKFLAAAIATLGGATEKQSGSGTGPGAEAGVVGDEEAGGGSVGDGAAGPSSGPASSAAAAAPTGQKKSLSWAKVVGCEHKDQ